MKMATSHYKIVYNVLQLDWIIITEFKVINVLRNT